MNNHSAAAKLTYVSWVMGHNWTLMPSYEYAMDHTCNETAYIDWII